MGFWCCCGGPGCGIVSDAFATDTDPDYTDVTGTGTVSGGERSTSDTNFLSIHNTAGTTGHGKVTVRGKVSVSGGKFRVVGAYVDASNYLFAEVTVAGGSSNMKLWKRVGGSDTPLGATFAFSLAINTYALLSLCWDGSTATAIVGTTGTAIDAYTGTGNKAGFGANLASGTATFDEFIFTKHLTDGAECPHCFVNCAACGGDEMPETATLVVTDFGPGTPPPCQDNCSTLNGTFILRRVVPCVPFTAGLGECVYSLKLGPNGCGAGDLWWYAFFDNTFGPIRLTVAAVVGACATGLSTVYVKEFEVAECLGEHDVSGATALSELNACFGGAPTITFSL